MWTTEYIQALGVTCVDLEAKQFKCASNFQWVSVESA